MIRVGYIAGEPTASRVPHLERIAEHPDLELTVVYSAATVQRREWTLDFARPPVFLRGPTLPMARLLHHDYPLTPQIWALLGRERFDVLVIAGWSLSATELAILWARLHRVPYLVISENHLRETRPRWVRAIKATVLRHVVPQASGSLVAGSLAREHALHYGARPDRITVFPCTVDVPAYREAARRLRVRRDELRAAFGIADDAVVVLSVARLIPFKGLPDLLDAVARASRLTSAPLHTLIVGDGEQRVDLEERARARELSVTFTGFRQGEALLECFAVADIFVLFSAREPWGVVVNEAAAFELPLLLSSAVGAAEDLLRPGENGELIESGDVDALARALSRLASDPVLRARYGARSAELVEPWDYESSVVSFMAALRHAVADRR